MGHQLSIQIDATPAIVTGTGDNKSIDWKPALKAVALEFETVINPALVAMGKLPIKVNSKATNLEDFLGEVNTIPSTDFNSWEYHGLVTTYVSEYDFINSRFFSMLPQPPQTFWLCSTRPPESGVII